MDEVDRQAPAAGELDGARTRTQLGLNLPSATRPPPPDEQPAGDDAGKDHAEPGEHRHVVDRRRRLGREPQPPPGAPIEERCWRGSLAPQGTRRTAIAVSQAGAGRKGSASTLAERDQVKDAEEDEAHRATQKQVDRAHQRRRGDDQRQAPQVAVPADAVPRRENEVHADQSEERAGDDVGEPCASRDCRPHRRKSARFRGDPSSRGRRSCRGSRARAGYRSRPSATRKGQGERSRRLPRHLLVRGRASCPRRPASRNRLGPRPQAVDRAPEGLYLGGPGRGCPAPRPGDCALQTPGPRRNILRPGGLPWSEASFGGGVQSRAPEGVSGLVQVGATAFARWEAKDLLRHMASTFETVAKVISDTSEIPLEQITPEVARHRRSRHRQPRLPRHRLRPRQEIRHQDPARSVDRGGQ